MAEDLDDDLEEEAADVTEDGEESTGRRGGPKVLLLIIGIAALVVIGGLTAAWLTGLMDPVVAWIMGEEAVASGEDGVIVSDEVVFLDLPEILVNLNTGERKSTFLKIRVSLELQKAEDIPRVETMMNRIMDTFNVYLRELRVEDLKGSAGMYRLREELMTRVSAALAPTEVNDILFKEMLVQ